MGGSGLFRLVLGRFIAINLPSLYVLNANFDLLNILVLLLILLVVVVEVGGSLGRVCEFDLISLLLLLVEVLFCLVLVAVVVWLGLLFRIRAMLS